MLARTRSRPQQSHAPGAHAAPEGAGPASGRGNAAGAARAQARPGPTGDARVDGALFEAFGPRVGGISAIFGQAAANEAIGAEAHARGAEMSFGAGVAPDAADPAAMELIAHEAAHALAPQGKNAGVDLAGDRGEQGAEAAGAAMRRWAERGLQGAAPRLKPAAGGGAELQRSPTAPTTLTGSPTLQTGARGGQVATLQTLLKRAGYAVAIDGDFGPATHRAVRRFQAERRLAADGVVGPATAAALNRFATATPAPAQGGGGGGAGAAAGGLGRYLPLKQGAAGAGVRVLQLLLNQKGARIVVDQEYGPMTANAVRAFQQANGLVVDGWVGPQTAGALESPTSKDVPRGVASGGGGGGKEPTAPASGPEPKNVSEWRDKVIAAAETHLGKPYWWGADGPANFDCSGFALYVLRQGTGLVNWGDDTAGGIKGRLPRTNDPRKGDMVFYSNGGSVEHVEIAMGTGSSTIGASGGGRNTRGNDPKAKVKYGNWTNSSRSKSYGSIQGLIEQKIARSKKK